VKANLNNLRSSRAAHFYYSLSPSMRAALVFLVPFAIVDMAHYLTAGTALVISFPFLCLFFLLCGMLAIRKNLTVDPVGTKAFRTGAAAGALLWFLSTAINSIISILVGSTSLGLTLVLGIPYMLLCGPALLTAGALLGGIGGSIYGSVIRRSAQTDEGELPS
jgi:hypothetical protein